MEEALKRLLDAEARADAIIEAANRERERLVNEALQMASEAEARFEARREEIRAPFLREGEARADQALAELKRKAEERSRSLREQAAQHEEEASPQCSPCCLIPVSDRNTKKAAADVCLSQHPPQPLQRTALIGG